MGNPFVVGVHGQRGERVPMYRDWIKTQPQMLAALPELRGQDLVCWCAPLACHGDVLLELANAPEGENNFCADGLATYMRLGGDTRIGTCFVSPFI
jgi:hypothetical protein